MKKLLPFLFTLAIVACEDNDQKIPSSKKINHNKGIAVIDARQRALMESDKILAEELAELEKTKASSTKAVRKQ